MNNLLIAISQRVDSIEHYNEYRDGLDQHWFDFIYACGLIPLLIPNNPAIATTLINTFRPDGVILSGGNDLASNNKAIIKRNTVENHLIQYCISSKRPLIGVCRGMQQLIHFYNGELAKIDNHVNIKHLVMHGNTKKTVNSYHNYGFFNVPNCFTITAKAEDQSIEAIKHKKNELYGIMWHPERNLPIHADDIILFKSIFQKTYLNLA